MSDESAQVLRDLVEACRAAPSSDALLRALLRAARETAGNEPAIAFLKEGPPDGLPAAACAAAARFLADSGAPDAALIWAEGDADALRVETVRALIALGRLQDAVAIYRPLIARAPDLKDPAIDARLAAAPARTHGASVVDLHGRPLDQGAKDAPVFAPLAVRERITFANVGGLDDVKEQIARKIILPFQKPSVFQRFRKKSGGGVLMFGPPGCGKTMLARATAGECGAAFINVEIPDVLDMYIGESEKRLAAIFAEARGKAPAVLFFDEIEALAARRRFGETSNGAAVVSTFLAQMDGFESANEGVLILAATNVPWAIDSAFRRHGRFERFIFVPPPDAEARAAILGKLMEGRPQSSGLDLRGLAQRASGFSGADLASLVEEACDLAIAESAEDAITPISAAHLAEALKTVKPTTIEWLTAARNYAKYSNQGGLYDDVAAFLAQNTQ